MRIHQPSHRRGVAMMLVIISLMMATILTASYLASRDNSASIGENVACSTDSRSTALAGLDLTRAIMQTDSQWRTSSGTNKLLDQFPLGNGLVCAEMTDIQTGATPSASSENIRVTVTASVDGVQETATAVAYVPADSEPTVDVDLSEFAVFAAEHLEMRNESTIMRWPKSPLSALGRRVAIGTQATASSSIVIADDAAAIDTTVFAGPGASSSLVSVADGPSVTVRSLAQAAPMPASISSGLPATALPSPSDATFSGGTTMTTTGVRHNRLEIKSNAVRTIKGNIDVVCEEDLRINSGGKLVIEGRVRLVVFEDLRLDQGSIELKGNSSLQMYVRGGTNLEIRDSFIGELRATSERDNSGNAPWMNPQRITVFSMPSADTAGDWIVRGNSVIKGSLYCPDAAKVSIQEQSALYGRIAARSVELIDDAAIFYDHVLDSRHGYTNSDSPLFDDNGDIITHFRTIASLNSDALQSAATASGIHVLGVTYAASKLLGSILAITPDNTPPDEPTPRPIPVDLRLVSFANDVRTWETENP